MNNFTQRTDLAAESRTLAASRLNVDEVDGVDYKEYTLHGLSCQELNISSGSGSEALGKPAGKYFTLNIGALLRREDSSFDNSVAAFAEAFTKLRGGVNVDQPVLIVGLGNREITPDSIGPRVAPLILVTRHLKHSNPADFSGFSPVSVITPGVLGTSGLESFDYIKAIAALIKPAYIIAIDALAARGMDRLCTTIQLTDSGISPGSGVGNARPELSLATMGIPVVAVGVPTVVDLRTAFIDFQANANSQNTNPDLESLIVTPRSIDSLVTSVSRSIAYGINMALHPGLTVSDIDMLLC